MIWPLFFSWQLWAALWRDNTALDRAEHWMNLIEPRFRAERLNSLSASDFLQLGGLTVVLLLLGPILIILLALGGVLAGAVRGALTAGMVARFFSNIRTARRLELLSMTPGGVFQACWAMVVYYHHRKETYHPVASMVQGAQNILLVAVGIGLAMLTTGGLLTLLSGGFSRLNDGAGQDLLRGCMVTGGILLALRYDTAISPLIGAAVGLWGGAGSNNQLDGRLWSMTVYIVIQAMLLVGVGALWVIAVYAFALEFWAGYWLMVALFFISHEAALRWVWWRACQALDIAPQTVARFKRMGVDVQSSAIKLYHRG